MEEREELKQDLGTLNLSIMFILLIIFAILLSLGAALIQREQLKLALEGGDPTRIPSVYPIRCAASAITIGCLGFFLCLALRTQEEAAAQGSPAAKRSARVNTAASLLVLLASIIRLVDLQTVEKERRSALLEETTLPD